MSNEEVKCQFCGKQMKRGVVRFGSGLNSISYSCECGSMAVFLLNPFNPIESINIKCEYEKK